MIFKGNLTINKLRDGFLKKEFSVREVVDQLISRIEKYDGGINSFLTKTSDEARKKADGVDKKIANSGEDVFRESPLLGIPIAHKDLFLTKGVKTTAASKVLENYTPQYSATVVDKFANAGAITLGKLNCDAWGHGASGENSDFKATKNPWNKDYVPGGSSSGSAAAVASGFAAATTGTDTGGSTRFPASFCGVVGLKPTYGRVSRYGVVAMASSMDSMGHLTQTVEDSALVLSVTAGHDEHDATSISAPVPDYKKDLESGVKGLKIGLPKEYFNKGIDEDVITNVRTAVRTLEEQGAKVEEVSLPHTEYVIPAYYIVMSSEVSSNLARYDGIRYGQGRGAFTNEARRRIMLGTHSLSSGYKDKYYGQAEGVRTLIRQDFEKALGKVDVLLAPVSPTPPFKFGERTDDPLKMYLSDILTAAVNLAQLPGLTVPCGFTKNNLPLGFQLIGKALDEATLFRVGHAYQEATDWHTKRPKL
ncbi:Asp-tRNA(Asn)/Glu-tRNA(Gln) amidotransferase GatCAB subunit A [Candidatus Woesebacteria bacterium]|nr:Asp-tRNA(Asn)/Glu-tRNA(Gln) amidotransferase GatCAB subunit A [Candidatus Woesebacteria bacterium]